MAELSDHEKILSLLEDLRVREEALEVATRRLMRIDGWAEKYMYGDCNCMTCRTFREANHGGENE